VTAHPQQDRSVTCGFQLWMSTTATSAVQARP
jgi:hypothetical protein